MNQFPRYNTYKPSGVDWLGDIPEHWEVKSLKHIAFMQSGATISPEQFTDEGYPVYGGNGFRGYTKSYTNDGEFVLIGRQGALCGNVNYASGKFHASEHAIVVYPLKNESVRWLGELIRVADFNRLSQSAAQPGIAVNIIKNEYFPYPPLCEQTAIATFLDQKTEQIEQAIAIKQQQIALLKERKQIIIQQAVTQGLNPNAPMKDSGVEWIGKIPEHWEVKRLKFLCSLISEKAKINGKTVIALENIESWTGKYVKTESRYSGEDVAFIRGDILFGKLRPYLAKVYAALDSGVAFGDLLVYRPTKYMFSQYCFYQMLSEKFIATVDSSTYGSKMPRASTEFIGEMFFLAPPLPEQTAIVTHIETQSTQIDQAIALQQQQIDKLKEYKTTLINSVVTGKVRVSDDLCDCVAQIDQDRLGGRYA